jgi:hypothetical protein
MAQSMTEKERIEATILRLEAKMAATRDEPSRYYYRCCLIGWRAMLARLG